MVSYCYYIIFCIKQYFVIVHNSSFQIRFYVITFSEPCNNIKIECQGVEDVTTIT